MMDKRGAVGHDGVVGLDAVGEQVAGAGALAAVESGLVRPDGGAGDLPRHRRQDQVALEGHAALLERLAGHHEGRQPRLHVGRGQAEHLAVPDGAAELALGLELPAQDEVVLLPGEARVHVAVDHQRHPAAGALEHAHRVHAVGVDLLADGLEAVAPVPVENELADLLLRPGGAQDVDEVPGELGELLAVDVLEDLFLGAVVHIVGGVLAVA